jgi:hypothetical protein
MHTSATSEFHPGRERPRSGELCNQYLRKEVNGDCDTRPEARPAVQAVNTRAASLSSARSHTAASAAHAAGRRLGSASKAAAA